MIKFITYTTGFEFTNRIFALNESQRNRNLIFLTL